MLTCSDQRFGATRLARRAELYPDAEYLNCTTRGGSTGLGQVTPANVDLMGYSGTRDGKCQNLAYNASFNIWVSTQLLVTFSEPSP